MRDSPCVSARNRPSDVSDCETQPSTILPDAFRVDLPSHEVPPADPTANVVTGTGAGWVRVGQTEHRGNIVLLPDVVVPGWAPQGFAALTEEDFASLLAHEPEIVLLGTGARQLFPHPRFLQSLAAARVGVDVMDTGAACRTFNILVAEDRRVAAALIIA